MTKNDEKRTMGVFERKVLRKIFGPVCVDGVYRRRWNNELYELYDDTDIVKRIKLQRLRWLGHVHCMNVNTPAKIVFETTPPWGQRKKGRIKFWKT